MRDNANPEEGCNRIVDDIAMGWLPSITIGGELSISNGISADPSGVGYILMMFRFGGTTLVQEARSSC